ncbi:MarR family winged helix-turn-helix transcriptional regulator [Saccharothrix syringae]|uniref:MarR family winged helix-turn-helix transcriptional regulator n=1 Tax=Saccharothrix syringae TaxID=103733 RepID=UPI000A74E19F|nr:MarR family winged helix-turn-helix transcriptional regulator [Saccharothrix syringae]
MDVVTRELEDRIRDLLRVVRLVKQQRHAGMPPGLVGILGLIEREGANATGCHAKQLAVRAGLDPSTVSRAVGALVSHGLVERRADPADGRASVLVVTDRGRTELADTRDWYDALLGRALADWTPEEVTALTTAIGRLAQDVEGAMSSTWEAAR